MKFFSVFEIAVFFMILTLCFTKPVFGQFKTVGNDNVQLANFKKNNLEDRWLAEDKLKHLLLSAFFTGYGYLYLHESLDKSRNFSVHVSAGFTLGLGVAKEIHDLNPKKGQSSFKDMIANIIGVGLTFFIVKTL